jgi:hypothetical protein
MAGIGNGIKMITDEAKLKYLKDQESKNTMTIKKNKPHYIAMNGNHGYLPDHITAFPNYSEAVQHLIDVFDLPPYGKKAKKLRECGYVTLDEDGGPNSSEIRDFGAEYAEIVKCKCGNIGIHNGD